VIERGFAQILPIFAEKADFQTAALRRFRRKDVVA